MMVCMKRSSPAIRWRIPDAAGGWRARLAGLDLGDLLLAQVGLAAQVQRHVLRAGGRDVAQRAHLRPRAALHLPLVPLARQVRLRGSAAV